MEGENEHRQQVLRRVRFKNVRNGFETESRAIEELIKDGLLTNVL